MQLETSDIADTYLPSQKSSSQSSTLTTGTLAMLLRFNQKGGLRTCPSTLSLHWSSMNKPDVSSLSVLVTPWTTRTTRPLSYILSLRGRLATSWAHPPFHDWVSEGNLSVEALLKGDLWCRGLDRDHVSSSAKYHN